MDINTDITRTSWNTIDKDTSKNYLHYYPSNTKQRLAEFMASNSLKRTLDLGCGNAQMYPILKNSVSDVDYTGVDFSQNLADTAREVIGTDTNARIVYDDINKFIQTTNESYDVTILCHMVECIESIDLVVSMAAKKSKYLAILWFDPPVYEYDTITIGASPHPTGGNNPYIRRKIGAKYWQMIT